LSFLGCWQLYGIKNRNFKRNDLYASICSYIKFFKIKNHFCSRSGAGAAKNFLQKSAEFLCALCLPFTSRAT
jgi:hypothetical protein